MKRVDGPKTKEKQDVGPQLNYTEEVMQSRGGFFGYCKARDREILCQKNSGNKVVQNFRFTTKTEHLRTPEQN